MFLAITFYVEDISISLYCWFMRWESKSKTKYRGCLWPSYVWSWGRSGEQC